MNSRLESVISHIPQLLHPSLSRASLRGLNSPKTDSELLQVTVQRSMPFEFVQNYAAALGSVWDKQFKFTYSDYDPALTTMADAQGSQLQLLWIDWRLLRKKNTPAEVMQWLGGRIQQLRTTSASPILVNNWPELEGLESWVESTYALQRNWAKQLNDALRTLCTTESDLHLLDLDFLSRRNGEEFFDARNDAIASFPFSDKASALIAQHLFCQLIPAALKPRLKAVIVDLDNTLHQGVLGEDGLAQVRVTQGHRDLQKLLLALKASGLMLGLLSKNEMEDVVTLFDKRKSDYALSLQDFAATSVGWNSKSLGISEIMKRFNIAADAIIFIDDNPLELSEVGHAHPGLHLLHAQENAASTAYSLAFYPGIYQIKPDMLGSARSDDIKANEQRDQMRSQAHDQKAYLAELQMQLNLAFNEPTHKKRFHEMIHKFNQFNTTLNRLNEAEAYACFADDHLTMTIDVSDRFADSGIVGAVSAKVQGARAVVEHVLFSCRALGRDIETLAFWNFLKRLQVQGVTDVEIQLVEGERNQPALNWLKKYVPQITSPLRYTIDEAIHHFDKDAAEHPAKVIQK